MEHVAKIVVEPQDPDAVYVSVRQDQDERGELSGRQRFYETLYDPKNFRFLRIPALEQ